jgi:hypothetical protein
MGGTMTRQERRVLKRLVRQQRKLNRLIVSIGLWAERDHRRFRRRMARLGLL